MGLLPRLEVRQGAPGAFKRFGIAEVIELGQQLAQQSPALVELCGLEQGPAAAAMADSCSREPGSATAAADLNASAPLRTPGRVRQAECLRAWPRPNAPRRGECDPLRRS